MTPTEEQLAVVSAAQNSTDNLLVNALAGAAKTSTLILVAEALPETRILAICFNKKIATELASRLPDNCSAQTLNSVGHRTWAEACGRRLRVESGKTFTIMKEIIEALADPDEKNLAYASMAELMRLVNFGKQCGYIPTGTYLDQPKAKRLMDDAEFFDHIDNDLSELEQDLIREVTLRSLAQSFQGLIDYDDQILMPTVFMGAFPRYPLYLVDEAQDLSLLNHAMLRKMVGTRRLIAVGDPNQAIYGFRGAHEDSMKVLGQSFSMKELTLSISFRCPREVVKHVRWKTPHMKFPDWAVEGEISTLGSWRADDLDESAAIICRNNAPLFATAIRLLKNGRHAEIDGRDMIATLTKIMRKFGSSDLSAATVMDRIDAWAESQKAKTKERAHGSIDDKAECMRIFQREGKTLSDALAYADHISHLHSPLKLMTGHKSKGLEFDSVYFLDEKLVKKDGQDPNLRYVIQSRAKKTLTYISSDGFIDESKENYDAA